MNARGSLLIGLVMSGLILSFALIFVFVALPRFTKTTLVPGIENSTNQPGSSGPTDVLKQAADVKTQADLKAVQTQILVYYADQGKYPSSLAELISYTGTFVSNSNIMYVDCSDQSAVLYSNSSNYPGYVFNYEQVNPTSGSKAPSCS
ncbi:MAG: hypothetical protein Q8O75_03510 [bacterium]|nr:hypothetical protein [bacterium]